MSETTSSCRRSEDRWHDYIGQVASLNGKMSRLVDVSPNGAKIETRSTFEVGSTVLLELPWGKTVRATVAGLGFDVVRLKFDFPIEEPF